MKVLVTGAAGQVGRQLPARAGDGVDVVGLTSADLDITDAAAVDRAVVDHGAAVLINCAAYTAVDAAESDEEAAYAVNAAGPGNLARTCARTGTRLIHLSTDYVFAGDAAAPYETGDEPGPRTAYGRTKLAGERAVRAADPTATVVRTAWVYTGSEADFVATMRRLEAERDTLRVVDDQRGSPTYAADLADGLLELARHVSAGSVTGPATAPVLHATNAGETTWFEFARAVFAELGADPERVQPCTTDEFPRPAPRPAYSVLSGRAWSRAGLTPLRDWRAGLHAALSGEQCQLG
ncbi:dTDP-4-dehydrorhamnose reductase [Speluncibacter jeojiensis]|uniref:dTDP-4-dehydrorhamnose reductase n=1 Tax=Speluncibacter jeojiensis TaxID=2710754 RepID=A0A9X4LXE3_9ACTN|nr:dTDP-4-dehydrorhamnose reductase [Corynebacteriales bacterium D3-21]